MGSVAARHTVLGKKPLPYDSEVEWLQSDGLSYVDTGISFAGMSPANAVFEMEAVWTGFKHTVGYTVNSLDTAVTVFGPDSTSAFGMLVGVTNMAPSGYSFKTGARGPYTVSSSVMDGVNMHTTKMSMNQGSGSLYYDGELVTTVSRTKTTTSEGGTIPLLACWFPPNSLAVSAYSRVRAFSISFTSPVNGLVSKLNLKAVRKGAVGYFYDTLTGNLLGNAASSGSLLYGPDIASTLSGGA